MSFEKKPNSHLVQEVNIHFYTFCLMPRGKKRAGVGATASCLAHFIHPSAPIKEQYPNTLGKERLKSLFITGRQVRTILGGSKVK